jgi:hypothetical protein
MIISSPHSMATNDCIFWYFKFKGRRALVIVDVVLHAVVVVVHFVASEVAGDVG